MVSFAFLLTSLLILPAALGEINVQLDLGSNNPNRGYVLRSDQPSLKKNQFLAIDRCRLYLQNNCRLALYNFQYSDNVPIWQSENSYDGNCELKLGFDGNLYVYNTDNNTPLYRTYLVDTPPDSQYAIILQNDCSFWVYGSSHWYLTLN
ncbi:hypothetical protein LUZ61_015403 [Rhynchospora tenuis]|uniref:non-specific serine/threonine protein kinase n=1 Tax=Rhynchospora tenuis TaxID=198213 RepID=A0AAD5WCV0_9POAL|nr:hypothetical protein LUZ61_015401 [Rhynchospora tenuis]KAJ3686239.1 hypothetical protein LUZ61_015403 [Rhynchospora tenuis]